MRTKDSSGEKFFYGFSLRDRVPQDHLLRRFLPLIDCEAVWRVAKPYYSTTGAPSVDPVVILKMSLLGYLYGITSERRLAEECRLNLAFMWFLGYDLDETPPDHSILSKARARFGPALYEWFFGLIVRACRDAGLIDGNRLVLDATLIKADASLDSLRSRSLHAQLPTAEDYLSQVWAENSVEDEKATNPEEPSAPIGSGKPATRLKSNERQVSSTDPDSSLVTRDALAPMMAHKVHIAVDDGPGRVITGVVATPGVAAECHQVAQLVGQHTWLVRQLPAQVVADKAYGTRDVYRYLRGQGVKPAIRMRRPWRKKHDAKVAAGFRYDPRADQFVCPEGKKLYRNATHKDGTVLYRTHRYACRQCAKRSTLCLAKRPTLVRRSDEDLLTWADQHLVTREAKRALARRMAVVEPIFAELKAQRGLARASLRRTWRVQIQAMMAATVHNLRQLLKAHPGRKAPAAVTRPFAPALYISVVVPQGV